MYQDKEIYLIDDIFSALDSRVGHHIFRRCIQGLLKSKTKILVSHHARYLVPATTVVRLDNGQVGPTTVFTLMREFTENSFGPCYLYLSMYFYNLQIKDIGPPAQVLPLVDPTVMDQFKSDTLVSHSEKEDKRSGSSSPSSIRTGSLISRGGAGLAGNHYEDEYDASHETRESGAVKLDVYKTYFQSGDFLNCLTLWIESPRDS